MPEHDKPTSEPSLPGFIEWLHSKDPNEHYDWPCSTICACGQYSASLGQRSWDSTNYTWSRLNRLARGDELVFSNAGKEEWTFGKLLARCEKEVA
jgi:hypothetical protein